VEDIMDEEETEVDFGIELGDVILIETENNLMAGTFMVHSELGTHIRVTHEIDEVQDKLGQDAVDAILEGIDEMDDFELIEFAVDVCEITDPWRMGRKTLRTIVASRMLKDAQPEPRQVLVAKAHPIMRIVPDHTVVTIDLMSDWRAEVILKGLDFEPDLEDEEDEEDELHVPEDGD
jgi:hypothetical protein